MAWTVRAGDQSAGGWNGVVCFDEVLQGHILTGCDVAAYAETFDGGDTWWPANMGQYSGTMGVATIISDPYSGYIFGGSGGSKPINRGHVVTIGGSKFTQWEVMAYNPGGFNPGNPTWWSEARPRSEGRHFEVQTVLGQRYLYARTGGGQLYRSTDDFATAGNSPKIMDVSLASPRPEGMILDPTNDQRMLLADWNWQQSGTGAYLVTNIRSGSLSVFNIPAAPKVVMEYCVIGEHLYAACGWFGVYRVEGADWSTWTPIMGGGPDGTNMRPSAPEATTLIDGKGVAGDTGQPHYVGISGYYDCVSGNDVLFVCLANPYRNDNGGAADDQNYTGVVRITGAQTGGSPTFESITKLSANVSNSEYYTNQRWWVDQYSNSFMLGKYSGDMANIAVDPFDPTRVHVVGRAGGHQTRNADAAAASVLWRPSVFGQTGTTTSHIIADPTRPNHSYTTNTDHNEVATDSDWAPGHIKKILPPGIGGNQHTWHDFGPDNLLYAVAGNRDRYATGLPADKSGASFCEVFNYAGDPWNNVVGTNWGWDAFSAENKKGGGLLITGTAGTPIVLMAVINDGIYRKVGTGGSWTQVETTLGKTGPSHSDRYPCGKDKGGNTVYFIDPAKGLYRSLDQGATWAMWWAVTSGMIQVAGDPLTAGKVYVCRSTGIYRVDNANTLGTDPAASAVRITPASSPFTNLQGMTIDRDHDWVYAHTKASATQGNALYECRNPQAAAGVASFTALLTGADAARFDAMAYGENWTVQDTGGGQILIMPGSIFIAEDGGSNPNPGIGPLTGGANFRMIGGEAS